MPSVSRNLRHGSMSLRDGQATPNTLAIALQDGDFSFPITRRANVVSHRGALDHFTKGEEVPVMLSFSIKFVELISKTSPAAAIVAAGAGGAVTSISVFEFLTGTGVGGALLTTSSGISDVYACTVRFNIANPAASGDQAEQWDFTKFHGEVFEFSEGAECNTIRISGPALCTLPTATRS